MTSSHAGSQHLLVTLLGTYFYGQQKPIPSAFLVRLLGEFGVTEVGARNGLSRVTKRGLLEVSRPGRSTYYRLSDEAHAHHAERLSEILTFGLDQETWDGTWTVAMFSVAERDRAQRHLARHRLGTMRFAMFYDGVWIRPGSVAEQTVIALKDLDLQKATVLSGASVDGVHGPGDPVQAFALDELELRYRTFVDSLAVLQSRIEAGEIGAAEALLQRTTVMHQWRYFPDNDPLLPSELLPETWPLTDAHAAFVSVYDGLGELADLRLRHLLADYAPELAADVRSLTSDEVRAMNIPPRRLGSLTGMDLADSPLDPDDED
ncbi:PaaX family transcriptional regulator [Blastococcus sp. PRF04-17]|uniref:PaaX family transcriptional regulator n=1 Tax=Blastococcus sp. PRF04-17 TaxID=2933797 RepID=UPI001FF5DBB8|nr:PaaX family transcriptional regulator C-terminal domain-containing protein [Blastococcus sp. PRF04-17]UOY03196.1 hypothetical protein MVA48_07585 [Blastococcus sp. PRF04-17]